MIGHGHTNSANFSMEAAKVSSNVDLDISSAIYITPVSNIRYELKVFSAIYSLEESILRNFILSPREHLVPIQNVKKRGSFQNKGYVSIKNPILEIVQP